MDKKKELLEYLLEHKDENRFIPKLEIAMKLGYKWCIGSQRNGKDIEADVRQLNDSDMDYIIISSKVGYKIATTIDEVNEYLDSLKLAFENRFYRYKALRKKASKNGLYHINFDNNEVEVYSIVG